MTYEEFLVYSARIGEFEDVKFCVDEKVDLNTCDESGNTALRKYIPILNFDFIDMACANDHIEIVKLLLVNGADVNNLNQSKNTPLRKLITSTIHYQHAVIVDWAALNGR